MKAIVAHAAKDLRIETMAEEDLGPGQVRLRMAVGGICGSDLHYYNTAVSGRSACASRWCWGMRCRPMSRRWAKG